MNEIKRYLLEQLNGVKRPWLKVSELAEIFEISIHKIYQLIEEGKVYGFRPGGKGSYRISKESVIKRINQDYQEETEVCP